jgi:hypothetical protein
VRVGCGVIPRFAAAGRFEKRLGAAYTLAIGSVFVARRGRARHGLPP